MIGDFSFFQFVSATVQSSFDVIQDSLREILKYESWTTNFEWNLLILICLCLIGEVFALLFAWKKYSSKIESVRRNSQGDLHASSELLNVVWKLKRNRFMYGFSCFPHQIHYMRATANKKHQSSQCHLPTNRNKKSNVT